ncbi:hypothetical protein FRX31_004632, partial [Thalictrum thalictroides]
MKDQPMPDALKGLVDSNPSQSVSKDMIKTDCLTSLDTKDNKHLANDVLTDPTVTAFYGDVKRKENEDTKGNAHSTMNFLNDPTATAFYGDVKRKGNEDIKGNAHSAMNFLNDPTVTAFFGDVKRKGNEE